MSDDVDKLRKQARDDLQLIKKAEQALAQIDRSDGLSDEHADVLAALRLRIEGKPRKSLDELLSVAGDISGKRDLGDALAGADEKKTEWPPQVEEKRRDWPGL